MAIDLVQVLHEKYHPSKAIDAWREGIFTVFKFDDGAELQVRKMFLKKLFYPRKVLRDVGVSIWRRDEQFRSNPGYDNFFQVVKHSIGNLEIVTRSLPQHPNLELYPEARLPLIVKILGHRVRFESPLFELALPNGGRLIGTKFVKGTSSKPYISATPEQFETIAAGLGQAVGKLHANGIVHGHPLLGNAAWEKRSVTLIDPKYLRQVEPPSPDEVKRLIEGIRSDLTGGRPLKLFSPGGRPTDAIRGDLLYSVVNFEGREPEIFFHNYLEAFRKEHSRRATSSQRR